jgi:hypothetical protein
MLWRCLSTRRQLLRKGLWGLLRLVLVPWLAVVGHQLWQQRLAATGAVPKFRTSDNEFAVRPAGLLCVDCVTGVNKIRSIACGTLNPQRVWSWQSAQPLPSSRPGGTGIMQPAELRRWLQVLRK